MSANLVIDKLLAVGKPVWIVSVDLSKALDRVNWSKLRVALAAHGVSQHFDASAGTKGGALKVMEI